MPKYTIVISPDRKDPSCEEGAQGTVSFDVGAALGKPELKGQLAIVLFTSPAEALVMLEASGLKERGGWMAEFGPDQVREEGEYDHIERTLRAARFVIIDPPFPPTIPMDITPIPVEEFLGSFR